MPKPADAAGIDESGLARVVSTGAPLSADLEAVLPDGRDEYEVAPDLARLIAGIVLACAGVAIASRGRVSPHVKGPRPTVTATGAERSQR